MLNFSRKNGVNATQVAIRFKFEVVMERGGEPGKFGGFFNRISAKLDSALGNVLSFEGKLLFKDAERLGLEWHMLIIGAKALAFGLGFSV
jgi:hypothetical protein